MISPESAIRTFGTWSLMYLLLFGFQSAGAILTGGKPFIFFEYLGKVGKVAISQFQGHHAHWNVTVFEHILGSFQLGPGDIFLDILSGLLFEGLSKVFGTQTDVVCNLFYCNGIGNVFKNIAFCLFNITFGSL